MSNATMTLLSLGFLTTAVACSDGPTVHALETSTGGGASSAASSGGAGGGTATTGPLLIHGSLVDATTDAPLVGAQVCLLGSPTCSPTSAQGEFSVSGIGSGFTATLSNYVTSNWPLSTISDFGGTWVLRETAAISALAESAGTTLEASTGALYFETFDGSGNAVAGVTVTLMGGGGVVGYVQDDGTVSATSTSTSTKGVGYAFQVRPSARFDVSFVREGGGPCSIWDHFGWPAMLGGTLSLPIVAGQLTLVRASCP